ncbi:hypothetical protein [Coraliomargarita parva]|uniref:hypothetical protein n=1 Tax=Coraliomargarita parva TaxID=3014050 RepID=UPI0022B3E0C3|nr:hypothetical protein [Coraliomargarita parva]
MRESSNATDASRHLTPDIVAAQAGSERAFGDLAQEIFIDLHRSLPRVLAVVQTTVARMEPHLDAEQRQKRY